MNIIPFTQGDTVGKKEVALSSAMEGIATQEGKRKRLFELQAAACELQEVDCPLQHVFAPDVYVRTIFIPAGTLIVGKIHKHRHANILSVGHVTVYTESGGMEDLHGFLAMVSESGTKRAVYAHTDTIWTTIHPTNLANLEEIEAFVIAETYEEYEQFLIEETKMKALEVSK